MDLKDFQLKTIHSLFLAMQSPARNIILKSSTGSGKTIILTHFMYEYIQSYSNIVFIWLTPGQGNLEEQSKAKMDKYIHSAQTKLLSDVMTAGFEENDSVFINWEKLTKKGNNALKDSERTNFIKHIQNALQNDIQFKIIVDESHHNNTIKADEIIQYFHTDKIIRCSATPSKVSGATEIEVLETDVIAEGLIKEMLIINQDFPQKVETNNQTHYLLERAIAKQRELKSLFIQKHIDVNPLLIVQLPNKSETMQDDVEQYFEQQGMTYENKQLAVWLSDQHENLEGISEPNAESNAVIIKQAVATGWDCPRAYILVKLRDNMDETFEIQTIGRIRRMPEAVHYNDVKLDSCYLYTFDEKFTSGVKTVLDKSTYEASTLFLKKEYKQIELESEKRTQVFTTRSPGQALQSVQLYMFKKHNLSDNYGQNKTRLTTDGYVFSGDIIRHTVSGETATLNFKSSDMNDIAVTEKLNTHKHGRDYHQKIGMLGMEIGMEYAYMNTIVRKLLDKNFNYAHKIVKLEPREVYSFVINNYDKLKTDIREAMAAELAQQTIKVQPVSYSIFHIPQECLFTYDGDAKGQSVVRENVYDNYLTSAAPRSLPEKRFEKFCEQSDSVEWFYKNGDKGNDYFSIVYQDNSGKQKLFYPDYLVGVNGETWIIETKGGFDRSGNPHDIDIFSPKKFDVLKQYLDKHKMHGGIVRYDDGSAELCICTEHFSDDIRSNDWKLLKEVIK